MSLLIKALEQAAESKNAGDKVELSLEPLTADATSKHTPKYAPKHSQQAASTVFSAKTNPQSQSSTKLAWFALATLILLLAAGGYFYWYWQSLTAPEPVVARPSLPVNMPQAQTAENHSQTDVDPSHATAAVPAASDNNALSQQNQPEVASAAGESKINPTPPVDSALKVEPLVVGKSKKRVVMPPAEAEQRVAAKRASISKSLVFGEPLPAADDSSVRVIKNQPAASINPKLIEAYNAYTSGDDAQAQLAYREVLKGDVRNTDALLGMATIAARQGRNDDAIGWYKKVLEIEPRNHIAQAGIVSLQQQSDPVSAESRLKNMIAQQPESAALYASLGDLYVSQNQWPSAQQAYFEAYHFEPNNVQHVFNLAVSLDHMGKSSLALPYYKRALELVTANGVTGIDRAKLESRISQLSQ